MLITKFIDSLLLIFSDMQQLTQVEQTRIKENSTHARRTITKNVNRDEVTLAMNLMQNLTGSLQFLTLLSCASSTLGQYMEMLCLFSLFFEPVLLIFIDSST